MEDYGSDNQIPEYDINALSKIYSQLTPEQKIKLTKMINIDAEIQKSNFERLLFVPSLDLDLTV